MKQLLKIIPIVFPVVLFASGAAASESIAEIFANQPARIACEILPKDGAQRSFLVFHVAGFNEKGVARYRSITSPLIEIRISPDGKLVSEDPPCLSTPVKFE